MGRQLRIAFIAVFVAVDVLLVALAVRHVHKPVDAGGGTPPTQLRPADSTTSSSSPTSTSASDPIPATSDRPEMLLSVGSDGTVLRATTGDCRDKRPGSVGVSTDDGKTFVTALRDLPQVVRVVAVSRTELWIVDADEECRPGVQRSGDEGQSWERSVGSGGAWHLPVGANDPGLHAPDGSVKSGCVGVALAPLGAESAYVGCNDGAVRVSRDAGATWSTSGRVDGLVSLTFEDAATGFALAKDEECAARVLTSDDAGATWRQVTCLEGAVPEAIATNGELLVAQVDDRILVSDDGGQTWSPPA